jgi:type VI secretion system FHA domain protein
VLAGFGPPSSAADPFADLIPARAPAPAAPPRTPPAPPRASAASAAAGAQIPDDFDPFAEVPAPPPPAPSPAETRGDFADLVPARQSRIDDLFGLHSGEPFPAGHPLAAPSAATTPGPVGIDDLLTPGAAPAPPSARTAPVQRDDAPELSSPMRLPDVAPPAAAGAHVGQPGATPQPQATASQREAPNEAAEGPGTVGGMRLSWEKGTADGLFDGKRTAVIGSAAQDRRRGERRRSPGPHTAATAPAAAPGAGNTEEELSRALLDGLGLNRWPEDRQLDAEALRRLGGLLRVAVQGTIDLLRARALIKSEVQAQLTMIVSRDNNPLKFSPNAEAALAHLLAPAQRGFMSGSAAMEDAYRDLVAHQFGFTAGTRAALADVLKRFDPAQLESRLAANSMLDALVPGHRKAKLWDLFAERFAQISSEAEDDFQRLLGKEFLRAYDEQVALISARRPES